jgi:hypothetical protein
MLTANNLSVVVAGTGIAALGISQRITGILVRRVPQKTHVFGTHDR